MVAKRERRHSSSGRSSTTRAKTISMLHDAYVPDPTFVETLLKYLQQLWVGFLQNMEMQPTCPSYAYTYSKDSQT